MQKNNQNNNNSPFTVNNMVNGSSTSADEKLLAILRYLDTLRQRCIAEMNLYNNPLNAGILAAAKENGDLQRAMARICVINEIADVIKIISGNDNSYVVCEE